MEVDVLLSWLMATRREVAKIGPGPDSRAEVLMMEDMEVWHN